MAKLAIGLGSRYNVFRMKIALIGAHGYVGSAVCAALKHSAKHSVAEVTREAYEQYRAGAYDVLINCAMPSGRFWAKNNPEKDYVETVEKTKNLLSDWNYRKFIQISTVSARCQIDTVYGKHKAEAEKLIDTAKHLIVRLGALYSADMKKGVLVDMLAGNKVYVDGKSRYSFISVDVAAEWIASHLDRTGVVELGGRNALALKDVSAHLGKDIEFEGEINHQDIESSESEFPEAKDVLEFLDSQKV